MHHEGRKMQQWRRRLKIKQSDLARLMCIDTDVLQALENRKRVPEAKYLYGLAFTVLNEFGSRPIHDLAVEAARLMHNTKGFIAGLQTMTDADTTTDFYRAKIEQARARVRIIDGLKFVRGPLEGETLFKVKFERGRHLELYSRAHKIRGHVQTYYDRHPVITEVCPV
jgi:transcriptional regulator with XRE-family HTH domain|uniref:Repressor protein CI n=1 Tax=Myoviridae sp. ctshb19 TaxID=2825194 RepID=A0A8S5UGK5_9CAUD|nr:MAG TPA: repressor protein CI [Myoviridae sp. ctshb19]